jgi:hypothetical protein
MMQELVVASRCVGAALETDDTGQLVLMLGRESEHDRPAHRAAQDHGLLQLERLPDRSDHGEVRFRRQAVLRQPPAVGWRRAAVVGQVEGDDPEAIRHLLVVEQVAILPAVGAGRMQAQQRDAAAGFLDEDAVHEPVDRD